MPGSTWHGMVELSVPFFGDPYFRPKRTHLFRGCDSVSNMIVSGASAAPLTDQPAISGATVVLAAATATHRVQRRWIAFH